VHVLGKLTQAVQGSVQAVHETPSPVGSEPAGQAETHVPPYCSWPAGQESQLEADPEHVAQGEAQARQSDPLWKVPLRHEERHEAWGVSRLLPVQAVHVVRVPLQLAQGGVQATHTVGDPPVKVVVPAGQVELKHVFS